MQNPGAKNLRVTTVAGILVFGEVVRLVLDRRNA
jgi:hypothetical protein